MNWSNKKVLVTGAGGFIGSHLTERLVELGADVRAFVHYNFKGSLGWLDSSPVGRDIDAHLGDIADRDSVSQAVKGRDVVFHLGALIAIPYSYAAPESYIRTNITGTFNVLQAVREHGCERMVHTSTSEVYGTARYAPIDEAHPLQGQSPYSASKIGADKMAEAFHLSFNVPVATLRPFNTYGPRQSARAVIPTIISQALAGQDVRLGNLSPTRDLNYVKDTVEAFLAVASCDAAVGRVLNAGSGREISVGDLARVIIDQINPDLKVITEDQRLRPDKSEVDRLLAASDQLRDLTGWKPAHTLEEGIGATIAWLRDNLLQYRTDRYNV